MYVHIPYIYLSIYTYIHIQIHIRPRGPGPSIQTKMYINTCIAARARRAAYRPRGPGPSPTPAPPPPRQKHHAWLPGASRTQARSITHLGLRLAGGEHAGDGRGGAHCNRRDGLLVCPHLPNGQRHLGVKGLGFRVKGVGCRV